MCPTSRPRCAARRRALRGTPSRTDGCSRGSGHAECRSGAYSAATAGALTRRNASFRTISATLGYSRLTSSSFALTTRISLTSSTSPLGQELLLITRSQPGASGSLLHERPLPPGSWTSMNVRVQLIGPHLQTVSALVVLEYFSPAIVAKPRNVDALPFLRQSATHSAAPIAPASPEYGCS